MQQSPAISWKKKNSGRGLVRNKYFRFLPQQYSWCVFGSLGFIKMSKGRNDTLMVLTFLVSWWVSLIVHTTWRTSSELFPSLKAIVRDVLCNVNGNKRRWQTAGRQWWTHWARRRESERPTGQCSSAFLYVGLFRYLLDRANTVIYRLFIVLKIRDLTPIWNIVAIILQREGEKHQCEREISISCFP